MTHFLTVPSCQPKMSSENAFFTCDTAVISLVIIVSEEIQFLKPWKVLRLCHQFISNHCIRVAHNRDAGTEAGTEGGRERGPGRRRPQCLRTCDLARPRWRRRHSLSAASGAPASGSGWPVPSGRPGGGTAAGPGSESEITSHACSAAPAAKPSEPVTGSEPRRAPEAAGRAPTRDSLGLRA